MIKKIRNFLTEFPENLTNRLMDEGIFIGPDFVGLKKRKIKDKAKQ